MSKIFYAFLTYTFVFANSFLFANQEQGLPEVKEFLAQLLEIREEESESKEVFYAKYRSHFTKHSELLCKLVQDQTLREELQKDTRLSQFFPITGLQRLLRIVSRHSTVATTPALIETFFTQVSDKEFEELDRRINVSVESFRFSQTEAIRMLLDPKEGVNLDSLPPPMKSFLDLVLNKYFDALEVHAKRAIIADIIRLKEDASPEDTLAAILNQCGPILQKAFQLFSKDVHSEKLIAVLERLRQNIKPFPNSIAQEIIEKESGFLTSLPNPIAAATMAQVYLLRNWCGTKIIIKVQRPGIQKKAEEEFRLLRSLSQDESILNFISGLEESFAEEVDFQRERDNLRNGQFYQNKMKGKLHVISELEEYKSTSKVLFLSCAKGKSIAKFGIDASKQKRDALEAFLYVWLQEAIFGSRIFHADLHPGNIFFHINKHKPSDYRMTLIDFGSIGRFTLPEAKSLLKIMIGINFKNQRMVVEGLKSVADWKEGVDEADLERLVKEVLTSDISPFGKSKAIFNRSIEEGILLPKSFVQFYRGESFIEKQIFELYEKDFGKMHGEREAQKAISKIFKSVFRWNILWDLCLQAGQDTCTSFVDNDFIFSFFSRSSRA